MAKLRQFQLSDISAIDDIFKKQPELGVPSLKHMIENTTILDDDGNVIGYAVLKMFAEGVLILDRSKSKKQRAKAVRLAVERAIQEAQDKGIEQLYFLTSNPSFADILRRKFSFQTIKEEVLMLNIDSTTEDT